MYYNVIVCVLSSNGTVKQSIVHFLWELFTWHQNWNCWKFFIYIKQKKKTKQKLLIKYKRKRKTKKKQNEKENLVIDGIYYGLKHILYMHIYRYICMYVHNAI